MLKANYIAGAVTANTDVPMTVEWNTNQKLSVANGSLTFNDGGLYVVQGNLVLTGITGSVTAQVYENGVAVPNAIAEATVGATTDIVTLPIQEAVRVFRSNTALANLSVRLSAGATVVGGNLIARYER